MSPKYGVLIIFWLQHICHNTTQPYPKHPLRKSQAVTFLTPGNTTFIYTIKSSRKLPLEWKPRIGQIQNQSDSLQKPVLSKIIYSARYRIHNSWSIWSNFDNFKSIKGSKYPLDTFWEYPSQHQEECSKPIPLPKYTKKPKQKTLQNNHSIKQKLRHFKTLLWYNKYSFMSF